MSEAPLKLEVRGLTKTYGPVVALADASIDMKEGEFLTLLGPSGSGKTTLLMIVAGLVQPSGGEVWIDGHLATYLPPYHRDIGMVFQSYALFPHLSVFENIAFPLRMRRMAAAEIGREVRRVLEIVQLPQVAERLPRELSGGQQQRIALARCMVYRPSIILMDEPLGALDKKLRDSMQLEIKRLHTSLGITVLYVTHDQDEAMAMSDRICLMNDGRIAQLGTPDDLYFRPASVFAADFLGESNIFDAEVVEAGDPVVLKRADGTVLRAPSRTGLRAGDRIKVMVRPESIVAGLDGADGNALSATIEDAIFVGGVTRYYARLRDGSLVVAKTLTAREGGALPRGSAVRFGWPVESTVLLAQDTASDMRQSTGHGNGG